MRLANPTTRQGSIASGDTTSDDIEMRGEVATRIIFPDTMTGTSVSFLDTTDGAEEPIYDGEGNLYTVPVVASASIALFSDSFLGVSKLKVKSNANEGDDRTVKIRTRVRG